MEPTTKTCAKCGLELPVDRFRRSKMTADGYINTCKSCAATSRSSQIGGGGSSRTIQKSGDPRFAAFTNRDLLDELRRRGFCGTLQLRLIQEINL